MEKFYILDWSWFFFRAYYALPELNDEIWNNINAIYWFFRMLISLLKEKPDYFVIAWDSPTETIRKQIFKEYKANRPKLPDNFKWQIKQIKKITDELNIPNLTIPWYEADDIIYSLVEKFKNNKNLAINILSSDKDLKQFLDSWNITIIDPQRLKKTTKLEFIKEYWFEPKYIVDWLSLVWDSSDNIPWIKWIWKKTATELIKKYKTIENIYQNIDQIPANIKKKLLEWKEDAFKSKELIKLMQIPYIEKIDLSNFKFNLDIDKLKSILVDKLKFKSFEKQLNELKKIYTTKQISLF